MAKKQSTKIPLVGSAAKACTDVKTPERTKNVPSKESEKAENEDNVIKEYNEKSGVTQPSFLKQIWNKAFGNTPAKPNIPQGAIEALKAKPELASAFQEKYGVDPKQYLGQ